MKHNKILSLTVFFYCFVSAPVFAGEVAEKLARWREHILTKGNLGGVELDSEDYRSLVDTGPNCLDDIFAAYQNEEDTHVLYYYQMLISRISYIGFYTYSDIPIIIQGRNYQCEKDIPFLSTKILNERLKEEEPQQKGIKTKKNKLIQWWKQRDYFTKRKDVLVSIRKITGNTLDDYTKFDSDKEREFEKLHVYGIYNIPYYIQLIAEDNNPIVFCDFLRMTHNDLYNNLGEWKTRAELMKKPIEKYPTKKSKIVVICDWWKKVKHKYTGLKDLYYAIEKEINKVCNNPD